MNWSEWMRRERCETGTVSRVSPYGLQLREYGNNWFNYSRYHRVRVPAVGTKVTLILDDTATWINGIEREENGE
jgi:hypothetical protein